MTLHVTGEKGRKKNVFFERGDVRSPPPSHFSTFFCFVCGTGTPLSSHQRFLPPPPSLCVCEFAQYLRIGCHHAGNRNSAPLCMRAETRR